MKYEDLTMFTHDPQNGSIGIIPLYGTFNGKAAGYDSYFKLSPKVAAQLDIPKKGSYNLKATCSSKNAVVYLVKSQNSDGECTILKTLTFSGKTNETKSVTADLLAGKYYVVFANTSKSTNEIPIKVEVRNTGVIDFTDNANRGKIKYKIELASDRLSIKTHKLYYNGTLLKEGTDYKITKKPTLTSIKNGIHYYAMTIKGIGKYSGTVSATATTKLGATNSAKALVSITKCDIVTTVKNKAPVYNVKYKGEPLINGKDYVVSTTSKIKKKTVNGGMDTYKIYTSIIKGKGNYAGKSTITTSVFLSTTRKHNISKASITTTFKKNGELNSITLKYGNTVLKSGTDYKLTKIGVTETKKDNKIIYSYKYKATGKGKYNGTLTISGTSQAANKIPLDLSKYTVPAQTYTGKQIKPKFTIKSSDGTILREGKDYKVTYAKNVNVGFLAGRMRIKGIGKYTGETLVRFHINKRSCKNLITDLKSSYKYTGKTFSPVKTVKTISKKILKKGTDYSIVFKIYAGKSR